MTDEEYFAQLFPFSCKVVSLTVDRKTLGIYFVIKADSFWHGWSRLMDDGIHLFKLKRGCWHERFLPLEELRI